MSKRKLLKKDEWNNEAAYDFKSITFCNLNTAGVDTYNDLPNDGSQYYYTFKLIVTGKRQLCDLYELRCYNLQQCKYFKCARANFRCSFL